jgi:hypothetical protein
MGPVRLTGALPAVAGQPASSDAEIQLAAGSNLAAEKGAMP